jgi:hypothetical protein
MGYFTDTEFDCVADLMDDVEHVVERHIQGMRKVEATALGLDVRCGMAWVDEDWIVCYASNRFDYYGGFEYVDKDLVKTIGDYKFYSAEDRRIADAIECLMEHDGECETE